MFGWITIKSGTDQIQNKTKMVNITPVEHDHVKGTVPRKCIILSLSIHPHANGKTG